MENKPKSRFGALSRRTDFLQLKETGRTFHVSSWLLVNFKPTNRDQVRCGWTIPRQVGSAVVRNRFRRWGREFLRRWARESRRSFDVNLVFKRKEKGFYGSVSHEEFDQTLAKLVAKIEGIRQ